MAFYKEESEDFRIEEVFSLKQNDTEEQTDMETNTFYSKKKVAICARDKRRSKRANKPCPETTVARNTWLAKKKSAALINRKCPAKVISMEQLFKLTQRILNLEGRVGWLEVRLTEKVEPSHPSTVDQSTSTDENLPMEIQTDFKHSSSSIHESNRDHSTSSSGHLDNFDCGAPPVVSTFNADHTLNVENVTPVNSTIKHEPPNSELDNEVQECPMFSPTPNTSQVCPPEMSQICLRASETPTNASPSKRRVRRSLGHGVVLPDVILNNISTEMEKKLYLETAGSDGKPRVEHFASFLFRRLIPLTVYHNWAGSVNYDGSRGKNALPSNLRQAISEAVARNFNPTAHDWKLIRDKINEFLRNKRVSFPII